MKTMKLNNQNNNENNTQNNIVSIANEKIPYAVTGTEYTIQLSGAPEGTTYALVGQYEDVMELTPAGLLTAKFESEGIMAVRIALTHDGKTQEMDLEIPVYAADDEEADDDE